MRPSSRTSAPSDSRPCDRLLDAIPRGRVDERAHACAELDARGRPDDRVDEPRGAPDDHEDAPGHAALPGAAGERVDDAAHGQRLVGIRRDEQVVLRAAEAERALAEGRGANVDRARRGRGADERHGAHVRMVDEGVHGLAVAVHHREEAGRVAGVHHQLAQTTGRERDPLRRLEHEGVPEGQREWETSTSGPWPGS